MAKPYSNHDLILHVLSIPGAAVGLARYHLLARLDGEEGPGVAAIRERIGRGSVDDLVGRNVSDIMHDIIDILALEYADGSYRLLALLDPFELYHDPTVIALSGRLTRPDAISRAISSWDVR
jgi:hypothetical protein